MLLSHENSARSYLMNGKDPKSGQVFRNHELAQSYKKISREGVDVFYGGEIGEAIDAPRISHIEGNEIFMEGGFPERTAVALEKKGHEVIREDSLVNQVGRTGNIS